MSKHLLKATFLAVLTALYEDNNQKKATVALNHRVLEQKIRSQWVNGTTHEDRELLTTNLIPLNNGVDIGIPHTKETLC